jgi:hypothetical protein
MYLSGWFANHGDCYATSVAASSTVKWVFDDPSRSGTWTVNATAGTVRLQGVLRQTQTNRRGQFFKLQVDVTWSGRRRPTSSDTLKRELFDSQYASINTSDWWLYPVLSSGSLVGLGELAGQRFTLTQRGPPLQEGVGANGKDRSYGASSWFVATRASGSAPSGTSCTLRSSCDSGDFNLVVNRRCVVETCGPVAPPPPPPPPACGSCEGKVSSLTLRYNGPTRTVGIYQKRPTVWVFRGSVSDGSLITINGADSRGTLSTEIYFFYDGATRFRAHTSCSQPIGPGMVIGPFTIVSGRSREGGVLCATTAGVQDTSVTRCPTPPPQ